MKYILLFIMTLTILTSCSQIKSSGSYAALTRINNDIYYSSSSTEEGYTIAKKIGSIKKKVSAEEIPKDSFESNYYEAGTIIYSSNENQDVLIALKQNGIYEILEKDQQVSTQLTLEEMLFLIEGHEIMVQEVEWQSINVFMKKLNGVLPTVFSIKGNPHSKLSIYAFSSEEGGKKGMDEFEKSTATMELINHRVYSYHNVLIFYYGENEETDESIDSKLHSLLK